VEAYSEGESLLWLGLFENAIERIYPSRFKFPFFTTFKPSEGYIAKPEAEQRNTYTASKKS
jgi:hypothetical protein